MPPSAKETEVLVIAVLSVSSYSPDRAAQLVPALARERLLDVDRVADADIGEIVVSLTRAGYHRGLVNGIVAPRVIALMQAIRDGRFDDLGDLVRAGNQERAIAALRSVNGIGPHVAQVAWVLLRALHSP